MITKNFKLTLTAAGLARLLKVDHTNVLYWIRNGYLVPAIVQKKRWSIVLLDQKKALELLLRSSYKFNRKNAQQRLKDLKEIDLKEIRKYGIMLDLRISKFAAN